MADETKHTPTPWHSGGVFNPRTEPRVNLWSPTPRGMQSGTVVAERMRPVDAALVLRAVNAHAALVEALRYILEWKPEGWSPERARDMARAALELAGVKP